MPLWELVSKLDEHFGIIADLDTLRCEFHSMKQGTHETASQFTGRVGYHLLELQVTFPEAIAPVDEEKIKKRSLYGGWKPHVKSAMAFAMRWQMREGPYLSKTLQDC